MSLTLYHNDMSVCAAKVRMALAEKGVPWEGVHLNLRAGDSQKPEYVKLNPNKVVPTLVHDGYPVIESNVICEYIEDVWPDAPLRPSGARDRAQMRLWMKQLDETLHAATGTVSTCVAFRFQHLKRDPEELKAWFAGLDPARYERTKAAVELGIEAPQFAAAIQRIEKMAADMDTSLARGPWLAGEQFSLADIAYASYMARFEHLGIDRSIANRPRVRDWRARLFARPSYKSGVADWFNPNYLEIFQAQRGAAATKVDSILANA
ncbi:MAG TPA: glutathione S-transferase family protein [Pseudolabrys sp.]|nr:glutathione S-transferase family protein [Pseudolabrys sp.]